AAVLLGLASAAVVHGGEVALVDAVGPTELTATIGRVSFFGSIGSLLGPLTLAVAAVTGAGWRWAFAAGAVAMARYAGLLRRTPMPPPRPDRPRPLVGVAASVRDRRVLLVSLAGGLFSLLDAPFLAFVVADMRARGSS